MNLMSAMGGISDKHIEEFAHVRPKRGRIRLWVKLASAACLAVIVALVPRIREVISVPFSPGFTSLVVDEPIKNIHSDSIPSDSAGSIVDDPHTPDEPPCEVRAPNVTINGKYYHLRGYGEIYTDHLPDKYVVIGQVLSNDRADRDTEGYGEWFKVGEKIYQSPDNTGVVYVYTKAFVNNGEYHYLILVDSETYKREALEAGHKVYW